MNKSESKYFNTANKIDEAFLKILEKKDLEYITVKEICMEANVNRSTFYLHYETIDDLLKECTEYINSKFLSYFTNDEKNSIVKRIDEVPLKDLYLFTDDYLRPYLTFIKDNKRLFKTAVSKYNTLSMSKNKEGLVDYVSYPIMNRFKVEENRREYINIFFLNGIMGIVKQWLDNDCEDSIDSLVDIIENDLMPKNLNKD